MVNYEFLTNGAEHQETGHIIRDLFADDGETMRDAVVALPAPHPITLLRPEAFDDLDDRMAGD
ncbi:MAG: hypothetical protein ACR2JW_19385 [Thermomicrobiales bacterium]